MTTRLELTSEAQINIAVNSDILYWDQILNSDTARQRRFVVEAGAQVTYVLVARQGFETLAMNRHWDIGPGASVRLYYLFIGEALADWRLTHNLADNAQIKSRTMIIGRAQQNLKLLADYNFQGHDSYGRIEIDGALSEQAKCWVDAGVKVEASAQQSDTRVDMRLYLDGAEARAQLIPRLEIDANDIKAGHSASTFKLAVDDLFYLQSRGLSLADIKTLQLASLGRTFTRELDQGSADELLMIINQKYE